MDMNFIPQDDLYISALHEDEDIFPISDEEYAHHLQLQEALIFSSASLIPSPNQTISAASCSSSKQPSIEASKSQHSFCGICMDTKMASEMFENTSVCGHLFCSDCIHQHVSVKIKENITKVKCPEPKCKGVIEPEACRSIVPKEVLDKWESILCESVILDRQKFYCPFKDCSAMLVDDGGEAVTQSECPNCHRLFCAKCKVAWHFGISCIQFQSLDKGQRNSDDIQLMNLAKNKKWMKCTKCKLFVEKVVGCNFIACRCGHGFCYRCGIPIAHGQVFTHNCKISV